MEGHHEMASLIMRTPQRTELWMGDYDAATSLSLLREKGIRSVLTVAALLGISYPLQEQINHRVINAFDLPASRMGSHFEPACQFINTALAKGNVLVHCAASNSRSTAVVIAYLIREGMAFQAAIELVGSKRPIQGFHTGFLQELRDYQPPPKEKPVIDQIVKDSWPAGTDSKGRSSPILTVNCSGGKRTCSLGPIRSLSEKLFLSIEKGGSRMRGRSLQGHQNHLLLTGAPQRRQKEEREGRMGRERQDGKLSIRKLSRQFMALRLDRPRIFPSKRDD